jgi:hypothetical protein
MRMIQALMDEFPEKEPKPNWVKRFIRWIARLLQIVGQKVSKNNHIRIGGGFRHRKPDRAAYHQSQSKRRKLQQSIFEILL